MREGGADKEGDKDRGGNKEGDKGRDDGNNRDNSDNGDNRIKSSPSIPTNYTLSEAQLTLSLNAWMPFSVKGKSRV